MNSVNETLIRDVVAEVLSRLNASVSVAATAPVPAQNGDCGCHGKGRSSGAALRGVPRAWRQAASRWFRLG